MKSYKSKFLILKVVESFLYLTRVSRNIKGGCSKLGLSFGLVLSLTLSFEGGIHVEAFSPVRGLQSKVRGGNEKAVLPLPASTLPVQGIETIRQSGGKDPAKWKLPKNFGESPREIRPINLLKCSPKDIAYIAGIMDHVRNHDAIFRLAVPFWDDRSSSIDVQLRLSNLFPSVIRLLTPPLQVSSSKVIVDENLTAVIYDSVTGSKSVDHVKLVRMVAERVAFLIREDLQNVQDGIYPIPIDAKATKLLTNPIHFVRMIQQSQAMGELYLGKPDYSDKNPDPDKQSGTLASLSQGLDLPDYYMHNFHSIDGGFLSPKHAEGYDATAEIFFRGTHRMARRMMLRPIWNEIRSKGNDRLKVMDLGTGTGNFLLQIAEAFPKLELYGIDLSPAMIHHAKRTTGKLLASPPRLKVANMENIPVNDGTFDVVTQTHCFHEMPEKAIRNTAAEIARVLRPGGLFLHEDALQFVDDEAFASTSRVCFDGVFDEPYARAWMEKVDMDDIFASVGLYPIAPAQPFHVSTMRCYRKK